MTEFQEPDVPTYREGAGAILVDDSGEATTAYFVVRGPDAPRMAEAIDTGSGIRETMEGYAASSLREGLGEIIAYNPEEDTWYLPEEVEERFEMDIEDGTRASELVRNNSHFEDLFTDWVKAAMSEDSPFAFNPRIETYESSAPVIPPGSEEAHEEHDGTRKTGVIRETDEGSGGDSKEYLIAIPSELPEDANLYDGEAFNTDSLKHEDGSWKTAEENGDWIWLDRIIAGFGTDENWSYSDYDGELHQSGEVISTGSNREVLEEIEDRNGLENGVTAKAEAFNLDELLEPEE